MEVPQEQGLEGELELNLDAFLRQRKAYNN